jgi:hypothetical protein
VSEPTTDKRVIADSIPAELTVRHQWVVWSLEGPPDKKTGKVKPTKVLKNPRTGYNASTTNPETWSTYHEAVAALEAGGYEGLGFIFAPDDEYAGVDLDHCRDPETGEIAAWAREDLALLASYTEASPSGTGVHVILKSRLPIRGKTQSGRDSTGRKKGPREVYDRDRFFTMTGKHIEGTPEAVEERQAQLDQWCAKVFGGQPTPLKKPKQAVTPTESRPDEVVIAKARGATNGTKFADLYAGRWEGHGYPSQSEADMALVGILYYWTQDAGQIDRIFRTSGLYRSDPWNRLGESTIGKVVASGGDTYAWPPPRGQKDSDGGADGVTPSTSQAKLLVGLALGSGVDLFHDQHGEPFAGIPDEKGRRILAVGSRDLGLWLRRLVWKELGSAPNGEVITTARHTVASVARFDGPRHELHVRVAWHEEALWVDLDGRAAVRLTPEGWEVVEHPPILFRCFGHQKPLPHPRRGGRIEECLSFLRITDPKIRLLFVCYLVAAMVPDIPIAALVVHGVQGATKTTLLKIVKRLLDPSAVEVRGGVRDLTEFAQAAAQNRVLFFDNLTSVPDWLSDALCRTVTGEGWSKRSLYTDDDSTVFEYRAVVGLAGINVVADRADLLDRSIIIPLEPVSQSARQTERHFWERFEAARPAILGGIFDVLAGALAVEPKLDLPQLPRMADFARWGAAAAAAMGRRPEEFLEAYRENTRRQNDAAIEASPIAQAILSLMASRGEWDGSPSDLMAALESEAERLHLCTKDREWPRSTNWVARRIRQVQPNLLALGVEFREERSNEQRSIHLRRTDSSVSASSSTAPASAAMGGDSMTAFENGVTDAVTSNPLEGNGSDDSDGSDSIIASFGGREEEDNSDDWQGEYEERAAIAEFDGGVDTSTAERLAREACLVGEDADGERCSEV